MAKFDYDKADPGNFGAQMKHIELRHQRRMLRISCLAAAIHLWLLVAFFPWGGGEWWYYFAPLFNGALVLFYARKGWVGYGRWRAAKLDYIRAKFA